MCLSLFGGKSAKNRHTVSLPFSDDLSPVSDNATIHQLSFVLPKSGIWHGSGATGDFIRDLRL
jgi:hypothetical protein